MRGKGLLRLVPALTVLAMLGPVAAGLLGALGPALGHLPAVGLTVPPLAPLGAVLSTPGIDRSMRLSVTTGLAATSLSLGIVTLLLAGWTGSRAFGLLQRILSPLLAVPHAAAAFGLAFLIAPSGWLARIVSPWATGWQVPPDVLILHDPWGAALVAGLVTKEVPFLLLMALAALRQVDAARSRSVALSLGYGPVMGWLIGVFPRLYAQIRMPVYVVLTYAMSVVDMALVLGPTTPPPLSVQIVNWMSAPAIEMRMQAAAGALLQLALVLGTLALWWLGERAVARLGRCWVMAGRRAPAVEPLRWLGLVTAGIVSGAVLAGIAVMVLWSVAAVWRFPAALPAALSGAVWMRQGHVLNATLAETMWIAGISTALALALVLGCLEAEQRYRLRLSRRGLWVLYLPLVIPQTAFLPGLQGLLIDAGIGAGQVPVILAHLVFVLPYVFLSLGDPYRAWDARLGTIAAALGAGPSRVLWRVRLPMLLGPVLTATAVGLAVSVGQYLPTLLIGGGRVRTLTTEALALSSGGDRRVIAAFGLMQTLSALLPFAIALGAPALIWRHRRGLAHG